MKHKDDIQKLSERIVKACRGLRLNDRIAMTALNIAAAVDMLVERRVKERDKPYACHLAPDPVAIDENKRLEPEGERLRLELTEWLEKNNIVSIMMDTPHHVVRIDIDKLPPQIKSVLTEWGSIFVKDNRL